MPHDEVIRFLLQIAVLLGSAVLGGQLAKKAGLPAVIGEMIAGLIIGPTVFGTLASQAFTNLFPATGPTMIGRDAVARIGLLLFLFLAGGEVEIAHFRQRTRSVLWTSLCGMLVPFLLGMALVRFFPGLWGTAVQTESLRFELLIGTAMAISALPVIARILKDLNLLGSDFGFLVLSAATADDMVGWTLFAVLLAPGDLGSVDSLFLIARTLVVIGAVLVTGYYICRPLLQKVKTFRVEPGVLLVLVSIFVLLASVATESIGVHAVVGAFLMGVVLKEKEPGPNSIRTMLSAPVLSLLAPIYFVSIGLKANFAAHFDPLLTIAITLVACIGKIIGGGLGAWRGGSSARHALAVGFGMNARGAMEIILASVALERHLIDERIFVSLVFMALFTSLVSGPMVRWLLREQELKG